MYIHFTERTQARVLPSSNTHKVTLQTSENNGHMTYAAQLWSEEGKCYELKILPIYRMGTKSLMEHSGFARVEICEMRENDWMLYRLAYMNMVTCKRDLTQSVANEVREALEQIHVINDFEPLTIEFRENGIQRSIHAF